MANVEQNLISLYKEVIDQDISKILEDKEQILDFVDVFEEKISEDGIREILASIQSL